MKKILSLLPLLAVLSTQTLAAVTFPSKLVCTAIGDCTAGHPNFCSAIDYFPEPVVIENPESFAAEAYDPSGALNDEELKSKVKLDFTDGDQYSFYFFDADALNALATGLASKVSGTYEDGYDWVNGYNTRAKFNIECSSGS